MDISGIQSLNAANIQQYMTTMKQQIDSALTDAVNEANGENGNPLGDSFVFSGPADLLSKLAQLQESDPESFKSLISDIADKLREAAQNAKADGSDAGMLGSLAAKFESVAETGDLSALQPPKMPKGGAAPPPQGAEGDKTSSALGTSGGAGGVAAAEEGSTCPVCSASVEEGASACSKCGASVDENSDEETSASDATAQSEKIAQYLIYSTEREQNSLLEMLNKLSEENENNSNSSSDSMSDIRNLLTKAFERASE